MARSRLGKLTDRMVRQIKEPGVYYDGGGLRLRVALRSDGEGLKKAWVLRYTLDGRSRDLGLGSLEDVSLAQARERAAEHRRGMRNRDAPVDPIDARRERAAARKREQARAVTFREAALAYIAAHSAAWKNAKHRAQWPATLEAYAFPAFGDRPVATVDREAVLKVLQPLWLEKTETASRLRGRIEAVLAWATVRGFREGENPALWRNGLDKLLPAPKRLARASHHASMPYEDAPAFFRSLLSKPSAANHCLAFLLLSGARYGEAAGARWAEVDLVKEVWTVPASRMKAGRAHRVALSAPALDILQARADAFGRAPDGLVFESEARPGAQLSDMTMSAILRRAKLPYTVHGFRSSFRTWAAERTEFPREIAEAALAHVNADRVEAAYQRSDLFEKRRALMSAWARFLVGEETG